MTELAKTCKSYSSLGILLFMSRIKQGGNICKKKLYFEILNMRYGSGWKKTENIIKKAVDIQIL